MIFTTEMIQLFAVVLGRDSQRVTEALLREGCMQFVKTLDFESERADKLSTVEPHLSLAGISDLRKRIEGFLHTGGVIPAPPRETDLKNRVPVDIEKESIYLDKIAAERTAIRERQRTIQEKILKIEDIRRQVELYGTSLSDIKLPAKHTLISMQIGRLPASNAALLETSLRDFLSLSIPLGLEGNTAHLLVISMKRDSRAVNKILADAGWTQIELPNQQRSVNKNLFNELSEKVKTLTNEQKKLETKANDLVKSEATRLKQTWTNLRVHELLYKIQASFTSLSRTVIFTGWLPSAKKKRLTAEITRACEGRCYLEWNEAGSRNIIGDEVPVQFNNPKVFAPFQMLVSNFGIPKYGTVDPTAFVMPLYLSMFGLMFADIGHGLVLLALGALGTYSLRKNEDREGIYRLFWLIVWCGLSSVLFGALFGSFFGFSPFKPLWFDFHGIISGHGSDSAVIGDVYDILAITIYFGISVIAIGLLFNWINLIRSRKWMELIFDKGGVVGGWIYAGGVYVASYLLKHDYKGFPSATMLFLLAGLPALLLFVNEPYHFLKTKNGRPAGKFTLPAILNLLMQWVVELLEVFSGYLSNTLSFMRVAGLGIAHVCLMIAFFTLADMTSGITSVVILVLGNILVIALEGLSAGVQALRLSYYEFFSKFFHGTGKLYTPISLNSKYR